MSILEVWLESWTMTDLAIFGTVSLVIIAEVFVRPILAGRRSVARQSGGGTDNGT